MHVLLCRSNSVRIMKNMLAKRLELNYDVGQLEV